MYKTLEDRFWSKVDIKDKDSCWVWKAKATNSGYGNMYISKGVTRTAHQLAYELTHGEYKEATEAYHGICIRHTCDNRLCCNPNHLLKGTQQDNIRDKTERKRTWSKVSPEQRIEIRQLYAEGVSQRQLGRQYKVTQPNIWRIIHEYISY